jgi:uncharacterized membrane protein YesL
MDVLAGSARQREQQTHVRLLSLIWRGTRDCFDQMISFAMYSMLWWLCVIVIIPGPAATLALYAVCDPRRRIDHPEFSDAVAVFRSGFIRSWKVALVTVPFLLILAWNLFFFAGTDHVLIALVPLWLIMFVILFVVTFYAFSRAATMESGPRNALRGAMYVLASRPFLSLGLSVVLLGVGSLFSVTVLPMVLLGPALFACIVNRVVLDTLGVPVIDPDSPTEERVVEKERGVNLDPSFIARLKGTKRVPRPE